MMPACYPLQVWRGAFSHSCHLSHMSVRLMHMSPFCMSAKKKKTSGVAAIVENWPTDGVGEEA